MSVPHADSEISLDAYKTRILLMNVEQPILRYLRIVLKAQNFDVCEAFTGDADMEHFQHLEPDLVLLDLEFKHKASIDLIRKLRHMTRAPILILSEFDQAMWKIDALDAGAEDYIVKPFSTGELLARMRVALRRMRMVDYEVVFRSGDLSVDFVHRMVKISDQIVNLTLTEYRLLRFLIAHADQPVTHEQLWLELRGDLNAFESHTVRVHLSNLRKKLETDPTDPRHILTEVGVGYRFQSEAIPARI